MRPVRGWRRPKLRRPSGTYLAVQLPDWIMVCLLAWTLHLLAGWPAWLLGLLAALWILKDVLLYPYVEHYYRPEPAERRMVGEGGTAVSEVESSGLVRVHGELWQAVRAGGEHTIPCGAPVRVQDIRGLTLIVTSDQDSA